MERLHDRDFLVTGASSGLGRAIVRELSPACRGLVLVARPGPGLEDAVQEARALGAREASALPLDLARPGAGRRLAAAAAERLGPRPGLVLNAGMSLHGPAAGLGEEDCARELALNAKSVLDFLHAFGPRLAEDGGGRVLITASIAGLQGVPEQAGYAATKAFLIALGSALAAEWRERDVRVTTYAPGLMRTAFFERAGIPLDRRWARMGNFMAPEDAARDALRLMARGTMLGTSGFSNRMALVMQRFLSRRLVARLTAWSCAR